MSSISMPTPSETCALLPETSAAALYIVLYTRCPVLLTLLVLLAACSAQPPAEPTASPTQTPQPPVMTMLLPSETDADDDDLTALEDAIAERSGVRIDLQTMTRYADALKAVCDTRSGFTAAWLDGLTYAAALAQTCGFPSLQLAEAEAPTTDDSADSADDAETVSSGGSPGLSGVIVVNSALGTDELSVVQSRAFCRINETDFYSWLLPALMFNSARLDLSDPTQVTLIDYEDHEALLAAVAAGDCAMAGVSQAVVEAGLPEGVEVAQTSVPFPFGVLVYPGEIDGGIRSTVTQTLLEIADDDDAAALLTPLFGDDKRLIPATAEDFERLNAFLATTGLDFAQLGR